MLSGQKNSQNHLPNYKSTNMNDEIQKALIELEESLKELDSASKLIRESEASSTHVIEEASKTLQGIRIQIGEVMKKGDSVLEQFGDLWDEQHKNVDQFLKKYKELVVSTESLTDYIKKVDFPNRLDKIDNSVTSINLGIQNLMLQIIEFKNELNSKIETIIKKSEEEAVKNKKRFTLVCVFLGLIVAIAAVSFIFKP